MSQIGNSLLHLSHRLSQRAEIVFAGIAGQGAVTARQLAILSAIEAKDGASQTDIVEQTGIDRSTMADVIKRLCRRKLTTRRRSNNDKRAYRLALTESGRQALDVGRSAALKADEQLLSSLSNRERAELLRLMKALANS